MARGMDTASCKRLRRTNSEVNMGPGTLYGTLQRMHDAGLVEEEERDLPGGDERRRYYRLTSKGHRSAVSEAQRLEQLSSAYNKALIPRST